MADSKKAPNGASKDDVAALYSEPQDTRRGRRSSQKRRSPLNERPIVCPPDGAGRGRKSRLIGYIARFVVIAFAVFGFSFFLADAFDFHYVAAVRNHRGQLVDTDFPITGTLFLAALIFTAILMLVCILRRVRIAMGAVGALTLVGTAIGALISPDFLAKCLSIPITLVNEILERLHRVNYLTLIPTINGMEAGLSEEFRVKAAGVLLTLLIAAMFVPFMARRVRLLPPALFVSVVLAFVFVCNTMRSNWAFVFLLAAFTGVVVMRAFDRLYAGEPDRDAYDTTVRLYRYDDRPELPEEVLRERELRETDRLEREKARAQKREEARERRKKKSAPTVDDELNAYFAPQKPKREKATRPERVRLTPDERREAQRKERDRKRAERAHKKELQRGVDRVRSYDREIADSRAAAGGLAGVAAFLLMLVLLFVPALTVRGKFETIPAIDERLESYREYLTALLVGDEDILDAIDYERDPQSTAPHSASLENRYYDGMEIFFVRTRGSRNVYLKGWIATEYRDGYWYPADEETLEGYRERFDYQDFPAESVATDFYRYMLGDELLDPSDESIDWMKEYSYAPEYGTILEQVNVRRVSDALGSLAYLPSVYVPEAGLRLFESAEPADLSFVNYFDGLMTGRDFKEAQEYAAIAYVTTMRDESFMRRISERIVAYNVNKTLIEHYRDGYFTDSSVNPYITRIRLSGGSYVLSAVLDDLYCVQSYYDVGGNPLSVKVSVIEPYAQTDFTLFEQYASTMTKSEKADLYASFENYDNYRDYVYSTYLGTDIRVDEGGNAESSAVLSSLSDEIAQRFSLQSADDVKSRYNALSYTERHAFVLAIVAYMQENCTYLARDEETLDIMIDLDALETDESLDAIENFLTVTKQGYCVQFASALTLLLREQGIPARYVEGYVFDELKRDYDTWEVVYEGSVRDYNFHAWVEVWYDGLGWVQYEATPGEYFYDMYPRPENKPIDPSTPVDPPPEEGGEEDLPPDDPDPDEDLPVDEETERKARIIRMLTTAAIVLLVAALIVLIIALLVRSAARSEKKRDALVRSARSAKRVPDEERRRMALALIDESTALLALYGLEPQTGELREEYADRLVGVMPEVFGKRDPSAEVELPIPHAFTYEMDVRAIQMSIAAEEFGGGMTPKELSELAEFYSRLRTQKKRFIPPVQRFFLHYFRHKI